MLGMLAKESVDYMESQLSRVGDEKDAAMVRIIMAHFSMKESVKMFGEAHTEEACKKEIKQIHMRNRFVPKHCYELSDKQIGLMLEAFIFLTKKQSGEIKARKVLGGNMQHNYISKEVAKSPTVSTEAVMITAVIDAKEKREVAMVNIPNAFLQTVIKDEDAEHRVIVRLRGQIVDILCEIVSDVYLPYVMLNKKGEKVLLVQCMKNALYVSMIALILFYKWFMNSLKEHGFSMNLYDACVANAMVEGKVLTICFHVDNCKISHRSKAVVDSTICWLKVDYEVLFKDGSGAMKVCWGKIHAYLGMTLDYSHEGEVRILMVKYIKDVWETYQKAQEIIGDGFTTVKKKRSKYQMTAAPSNLFDTSEECKILKEWQREVFHLCVAKVLYFAKRSRLDLLPSVAFLSKRVKSHDQADWEKLGHMIKNLKSAEDLPLILGANNSDSLYWYADSTFGVHKDMKSHTGGGLMFEQGFSVSVSTGQKLNSGSSTITELIAVSNVLPKVQWVHLFVLAQGVPVTRNIIYQDNTSSILLEINSKNRAVSIHDALTYVTFSSQMRSTRKSAR